MELKRTDPSPSVGIPCLIPYLCCHGWLFLLESEVFLKLLRDLVEVLERLILFNDLVAEVLRRVSLNFLRFCNKLECFLLRLYNQF